MVLGGVAVSYERGTPVQPARDSSSSCGTASTGGERLRGDGGSGSSGGGSPSPGGAARREMEVNPGTSIFLLNIWKRKLLHTGHDPRHLCSDFRAYFQKKNTRSRMKVLQKEIKRLRKENDSLRGTTSSGRDVTASSGGAGDAALLVPGGKGGTAGGGMGNIVQRVGGLEDFLQQQLPEGWAPPGDLVRISLLGIANAVSPGFFPLQSTAKIAPMG